MLLIKIMSNITFYCAIATGENAPFNEGIAAGAGFSSVHQRPVR